MDGEAGWWTTSGNIGLPPLARAMGVGRQQQAHRKAREILEGVQRRQKKYYDLRKRTTIYEVGDVVLKKNNAGVLGSSRKLNIVSCMLGN